jgi:hypothetical protein
MLGTLLCVYMVRNGEKVASHESQVASQLRVIPVTQDS